MGTKKHDTIASCLKYSFFDISNLNDGYLVFDLIQASEIIRLTRYRSDIQLFTAHLIDSN